jgi:hypothetical protein
MLIGIKNSDDHYLIVCFLYQKNLKEFKLESKLIFFHIIKPNINVQNMKLFHI